MHTFETPQPVRLRVELLSGRVDITATDTTTTTVELSAIHGGSDAEEVIADTKVEQRGDEIVVLVPRVKGGLFRSRIEIEVRVEVPSDSAAKVQTGSADIEARGRLAQTKVETGSGDVAVEHGSDIDIKTGSGDIWVGAASGTLKCKGGSADVEVGKVGGDADILSGSGDVVLGAVAGLLKVKSGSGDVVVRDAGDGVDAIVGSGDVAVRGVDHGVVKAKTGSGDVAVSIVEGTATYLDVSTVTGELRSDLDGSAPPEDGAPTAEVSIYSGSGDVVLQRA